MLFNLKDVRRGGGGGISGEVTVVLLFNAQAHDISLSLPLFLPLPLSLSLSLSLSLPPNQKKKLSRIEAKLQVSFRYLAPSFLPGEENVGNRFLSLDLTQSGSMPRQYNVSRWQSGCLRATWTLV